MERYFISFDTRYSFFVQSVKEKNIAYVYVKIVVRDFMSILELICIIVGILYLGFVVCLIIFFLASFVRKYLNKFSFTKLLLTFFPYELKEDDKVALSVISIKMENTIQAITSDRNTK